MVNTEKVSLNVNIVDLGKIDLLIERGIFTNRTDFITRAIYDELEKNGGIIETVINEQPSGTAMMIGMVSFTVEDLWAIRSKKKIERLYVIGKLIIDDAVPLELAKEAIKSIRVFGSFKMPDELIGYYFTKGK